MALYNVDVGGRMGELLLCNESIAAMPYYIEGISLNLYSIEEMCYYISNNTFLIERDFMCEELCTWIANEAKLPTLAEKLRDILRAEGLLSDFVLQILQASGYCSMQEMQEIIFTIRQMEEKSDFECNKIRADKLLENEKYLSSIYEYKRLLDQDGIENENAILVGNIWHNLGTAYARLFLFEEAIKCYKKAYKLNEKTESIRECLLAYRCMHDEAGFINCAAENHIDDMGMIEIKNELSIASRNEETKMFEDRLEAIAMISENNKTEYQHAINKIILSWKEDYRRISRV